MLIRFRDFVFTTISEILHVCKFLYQELYKFHQDGSGIKRRKFELLMKKSAFFYEPKGKHT